MFKGIVNWFKGSNEQEPGSIWNGENNMTGKIVPTQGKFALVNTRTGQTIATYSRARDAVRGANRRGFTVNA